MTFKNVDYCLHVEKEGGGEGYRKRVRERENEMESERRGKHPIGEVLG